MDNYPEKTFAEFRESVYREAQLSGHPLEWAVDVIAMQRHADYSERRRQHLRFLATAYEAGYEFDQETGQLQIRKPK